MKRVTSWVCAVLCIVGFAFSASAYTYEGPFDPGKMSDWVSATDKRTLVDKKDTLYLIYRIFLREGFVNEENVVIKEVFITNILTKHNGKDVLKLWSFGYSQGMYLVVYFFDTDSEHYRKEEPGKNIYDNIPLDKLRESSAVDTSEYFKK